MLTYEGATELLYMNLEEEEDLRILQEAASIRAQWRCSQVRRAKLSFSVCWFIYHPFISHL
jgi:hypothetical protein